MTGFGIPASALAKSCRSRECPADISAYDIGAISLMSAPAAKTRSPPYSTTAATASSCVTSRAASISSRCIWAFRAFIFGRSSLIVATPSSTSTRTNSPTAILLCTLGCGRPEPNQRAWARLRPGTVSAAGARPSGPCRAARPL